MRHKSFFELEHIIQNENVQERNRLLQLWWRAYIVQQTATQLVTNRSVLTSQQNTLACEAAAEAVARELMFDDAVNYTITNTRYEATILAVRNKPIVPIK